MAAAWLTDRKTANKILANYTRHSRVLDVWGRKASFCWWLESMGQFADAAQSRDSRLVVSNLAFFSSTCQTGTDERHCKLIA